MHPRNTPRKQDAESKERSNPDSDGQSGVVFMLPGGKKSVCGKRGSGHKNTIEEATLDEGD